MSTAGNHTTRRGSRWTIPNILCIFRMMMVPVFVWTALRGWFELALALFVGAALTDALDGWIARRFDMRSRLGAFLDPAADKTLMVTSFIVFTLPSVAPRPIPQWLTFTVFSRDVLIVLFAYLLYTRIRVKRFPPSISGKVSTIVQVVTVAATIAGNTALAGDLLSPFLPPLYGLALAMTLLSGFDYLRKWNAVVLSGG